MLPGDALREILRASRYEGARPLEELNVGLMELELEEEQSPRWPSGILAWDNKSGGGYGFTAVSGKKKLGKTLIAIRASVMAAETGRWSVHYAYGENTANQVRTLARRVLGPARCDELPAWMENWRSFRFHYKHTIDALLSNVEERILPDHEQVLVVIDSINRLARCSNSDYLAALGRICRIVQTCAEESAGRISFLVLSETNQRGGMIGLDLEHSAGCLLFLRQHRDPGKVKMVLESRESEGGDLGEHLRDWEKCQFVTELAIVDSEQRRLQQETLFR